MSCRRALIVLLTPFFIAVIRIYYYYYIIVGTLNVADWRRCAGVFCVAFVLHSTHVSVSVGAHTRPADLFVHQRQRRRFKNHRQVQEAAQRRQQRAPSLWDASTASWKSLLPRGVPVESALHRGDQGLVAGSPLKNSGAEYPKKDQCSWCAAAVDSCVRRQQRGLSLREHCVFSKVWTSSAFLCFVRLCAGCATSCDLM